MRPLAPKLQGILPWLERITSRVESDLLQTAWSANVRPALELFQQRNPTREELKKSFLDRQERLQDLRLLVRHHGLANTTNCHRKSDLAELLVDGVVAQYQVLEKYSSMVVMDVGTKNLAWVEYPLRQDCASASAAEAGEGGGTAKFQLTRGALTSVLTKPGQRNMPAAFARDVFAFLERSGMYPHRHTDRPVSTGYSIELQMQRHNPSCAMIEAQLHGFLYPHAYSFSPISIGNYFEITQQSRMQVDPKELRDEYNRVRSEKIKERGGNYGKKELAVALVQFWLHQKRVLEVGQPLQNVIKEAKKRDDLADSVLSALAQFLWSRKLLLLGRQLLES